ncbi:MAG: hypothetical protein Q8R57_15160, partial [Bacteroidota bacterium]|nr:hypothetical protein [Bacteroidota bacterium]
MHFGNSAFGNFTNTNYPNNSSLSGALLTNTLSTSNVQLILDNLDLQGFIMADPNTNLVTILGQFNQVDLANHLSNWLYTEGDFTSFLTNICTNHHEFILYSLQNGSLYDFFLYFHTHYTADFENMYMALSSNSFVDFNTSYNWFILNGNMSDVSLWMQTNLDCNVTANMLLNLPDIQNILKSWFNSLSDIANPIYNGFAEPNTLWNYLVQYDNTNLRSIIYSQFDNNIMLTWFETNERTNFITHASSMVPGHVGTWQTSHAGHSKETYFNMVKTYYGQSAYDLLIQRYLNNTRTYLDSFGIAEWHIYGSSRLGIYQSNLNLVTQRFDADVSNGSFEDPENISTTSYEPSYNFYTLQRGNKRYELSNHLGNVLAVISDRKLLVCNEYNKLEDFEGTPNLAGAWNVRDSWSGQNAVISLEDGKLNIKDNITADPHARYNYFLGKDIPPNQSIRLSFDLEHVEGDHDWQVGIVYSTTENAYQGNMIYFSATSGHNEINFVTPGYFWRVRLLHIPTAQDMEFNLDNFHIENLTQ